MATLKSNVAAGFGRRMDRGPRKSAGPFHHFPPPHPHGVPVCGPFPALLRPASPQRTDYALREPLRHPGSVWGKQDFK